MLNRNTFRYYITILLITWLSSQAMSMAVAGVNLPKQNLCNYTPAQWNNAFALVTELPLSQRIALWADLASVDASYVADPLGEGSGHLPDTDPLNDFKHVDCVTYVEQVYALSLATSYSSFTSILQHIRYRDSVINYRWRNHYTVSDWLPANAWFLQDITDTLSPGDICTMTKTISHATFFKQKYLTQYAEIPDEETSTNYIPRGSLAKVVSKLHTGDMVIFVIDTPGIIAGHVGLLRMKNGKVYLQHASATTKAVITVPLLDYMRDAPRRFLGCKFIHPAP